MTTRGLLPAVALAGAVIFATAGCSTSGGTPTGGGAATTVPAVAAPRTPPAVPVSGLARGMILPLEAYEEPLPEYAVILRARLALESSCMSGYGFSFAPKADIDSISYDASNMERRYGLSDPAEAAAYGYSVPASAPGPPDPVLSQQESRVLTGAATVGGPPSPAPGTYGGKAVPPGGCVGQADRQLGDPPDIVLADQLDQRSLTESLALPGVSAAIGRWSDCMRRNGYAAASPLTASLLTRQAGASPGDAVDRKIAVADVVCKESTNLTGIWFAAESTLQTQYIAANQIRLQQDVSALAAARGKAESILAGGPGAVPDVNPPSAVDAVPSGRR